MNSNSSTHLPPPTTSNYVLGDYVLVRQSDETWVRAQVVARDPTGQQVIYTVERAGVVTRQVPEDQVGPDFMAGDDVELIALSGKVGAIYSIHSNAAEVVWKDEPGTGTKQVMLEALRLRRSRFKIGDTVVTPNGLGVVEHVRGLSVMVTVTFEDHELERHL